MELRDDRGQHGILLWSPSLGRGAVGTWWPSIRELRGHRRSKSLQRAPSLSSPTGVGGLGCGPCPQVPIATLLWTFAPLSSPAPARGWHSHAAARGLGRCQGWGAVLAGGLVRWVGDSVGACCCRMERDKAFVRRKAERATVRMHLRDKYHLAQDERDDAQLHIAGGAVELPQELAAMVHSEEEEEEEEDGGARAFAFLTKLREVDLPALRDRALGSVDEVKEKCTLM
uniref:Uncharacterized protein n=1 Tax=Accipiter nisus TaxID=211598 RepID=A0A8B9RQ83_9AVES